MVREGITNKVPFQQRLRALRMRVYVSPKERQDSRQSRKCKGPGTGIHLAFFCKETTTVRTVK